MSAFPLLFVVAVGFVVNAASFPHSDLAFPEEINGVNAPLEGHDRFHREFKPEPNWIHEWQPHSSHYRPEYLIPPGSRPGNSRPNTGSGFGVQELRPLARPQGLRPTEIYRPQGPVQQPKPSFVRPGGDFRPQGSRPFGELDPQDSRPFGSRPAESTRPQFSRPIENSRPQNSGPVDEPLGLRPGANSRPQQSRPNESSRPQGTNPDSESKPESFQPDFLDIGSSGTSDSQSQNSGFSESSSIRPEESSSPSDTQVQSVDESTSGSTETTTKIPRRDPTYRIVYTASCPCVYTRQYEPVCGTDGQTYGNIGILQCAQQCGADVQLFLNGSCGRNNGHPGAISLKY